MAFTKRLHINHIRSQCNEKWTISSGLNLTDLNGQNGFKLDGENRGDYPANYSVSRFINGAGDVNSDGYADLIIGVGVIRRAVIKAAAT